MLHPTNNSPSTHRWKSMPFLILLSLLAFVACAPESFWERIANNPLCLAYSRLVRIPFANKEWSNDDQRQTNRSCPLGQRWWLIAPKDYAKLPLSSAFTKIGHIAWVLDLGLHNKHSLIAADSDKLYFTTKEEVFAVDEIDGALRWNSNPRWTFSGRPAVVQSALVDGRLVASFEGPYSPSWFSFCTKSGKMTEHREIYSVENGRDLLTYPFHGPIISKSIWNHIYEGKQSKWFPSNAGHRILRVGNKSTEEYERVTIDNKFVYIRNQEGHKESFCHYETNIAPNSSLIPARYPDGCRDEFKGTHTQVNRFVSPDKETFNDDYLLLIENRPYQDKYSSITVLGKNPFSGHYYDEAHEHGNIESLGGNFHLKKQGLIAYGWFNASQKQDANLIIHKIGKGRLHKVLSLETKYRTQWIFTNDRLYFLYLGLLYAISI